MDLGSVVSLLVLIVLPGYNDNGQLGCPDTGGFNSAPVLLKGHLEHENIRVIGAGAYHTLAVSDKGQLFAW